MSTGTATLTAVKISAHVTQDSRENTIEFANEQVRQTLLEKQFGHELYLGSPTQQWRIVADWRNVADWPSILQRHEPLLIWENPISQPIHVPSNLWGTPKFKSMLNQPVGSPIELTLEEAEEIVKLAAGSRPDLPTGKDFVKEVRTLLGHSIIGRILKHG